MAPTGGFALLFFIFGDSKRIPLPFHVPPRSNQAAGEAACARRQSRSLSGWSASRLVRWSCRSLDPPPPLDVYGTRTLFFTDAHEYRTLSGFFFISDVSQLLSDAEKWVNFIPNMVRRHLFAVVEQVFDFKALLSSNSFIRRLFLLKLLFVKRGRVLKVSTLICYTNNKALLFGTVELAEWLIKQSWRKQKEKR